MSITRVNNNVSSLNAARNLNANGMKLGKSLERLSSGLRINRAGDDAAGLAISEKMRGQIRGLSQAQRNSQDAISLLQTAEGAMNEIHNNLQRLRELAVQAYNGTNTSDDVASIQKEVTELVAEINRIGTQTQFNTSKLLNAATTSVDFQVGANAGETVTVSVSGMRANGVNDDLGVYGLDIDNATTSSITTIDAAIKTVSDARAEIGAGQNRVESTITNLGVAIENLTASESRIRDADIAFETTQFTRNQILVQAGTSILSQANMAPQGVLSLLQG